MQYLNSFASLEAKDGSVLRNVNSISLTGSVVKDSVANTMKSGDRAVNRFRLASTIREDNKAENKPGESLFVDCEYWTSPKFTGLKKGQFIAISGMLKNHNWKDKDGANHYDFVIDVSSLEIIKHAESNAQKAASQPAQTATPKVSQSVSTPSDVIANVSNYSDPLDLPLERLDRYDDDIPF